MPVQKQEGRAGHQEREMIRLNNKDEIYMSTRFDLGRYQKKEHYAGAGDWIYRYIKTRRTMSD